MKKKKIALLGMGTVGSGTFRILEKNRELIKRRSGYDLEVGKVLVRDASKKRGLDFSQELMTENYEDILKDEEIEIVVELMGGIDPAKDYILRAIENGKHVVTANKALIANHGEEILKKAKKKNVMIMYEASVAGGIPILQTIKESLAGNQIEEIMGIVNGTTNYILSKMTKDKVDFEFALKEAQEKGYAEADPTADIECFDAAHKLTILSHLCFEGKLDLDSVYREGITKITSTDIEYADELGYVIKLLAIGKEDQGELELRVHPTFVPKEHPLASVSDAFNAVFLKGDAVGDLMLYGMGAGDLPTGSAVVGDIINIAKNMDNKVKHVEVEEISKKIKPMENTESEYYIRILGKDTPGVLGDIASKFGENDVSLRSVLQKGEGDPAISLVFITHKTKEGNINKAIESILKIDEVIELANLIRVENSEE